MERNTEVPMFMSGGNEAGIALRQCQWNVTTLGSPLLWEQNLKTVLTVLLQSKIPMALLWGMDNIFFCNDEYQKLIPGVGELRSAIGQPASSIYKDGWPSILTAIDRVKGSGRAIENGSFLTSDLKSFHADYSPIFGRNDFVDGILISHTEISVLNPQATSIFKTQFQLAQSEQHLQLLRDTVPAMIFYLDQEQRYQSYNQVFREWFGVGNPDAIGKTVREFLGEAAYGKVSPHLDIAYGGKQERYELFAPSRMGVPRWLDIVYTPHIDNSGKVIGLIVHATDITKIKRTEISLRESEARFRSLIEHAPVATCLLTGKEFTIEFANDLMLGVLGKDVTVIGKPLEEAVPEIKGQPFLDILTQVFTTGIAHSETAAPAQLEVNGILGTYYFNYTYKPLFNESGEVYGIMDMSVDVTEQVLIRKKVEESEKKLRTLIQSAPPAIGMFVGRELIIESPNQSFKDTIGRGNDIEGKSLRELMPELEQQPFLTILDKVFETGEMFQADSAKLEVLVNGILEEKYFNVTFSPLFDNLGEVYAIIDVSVDVTARVIATKITEAREKELRDIIIAAPVGLCVISSPDMHILEVNEQFLEIAAVERHIESSPLLHQFGPMSTIFRNEVAGVARSGIKRTTEEHKIQLMRNGIEETIFVTFEYVPLFDDRNSVSKVMIIAIEMTHQVHMRQEIEKAVTLRTRELAALNINLQRSNNELEQFAFIASHDLQEPVRKINTFIGMLEGDLLGMTAKTRNYLDKIKASTSRMEALIRDVLAFSIASQKIGKVSQVDLQKILEEVEIENELQIVAKNAVLHYNGLPRVRAVPSQMIQLFSNLIGNALKYSRDGISPIVTISSSAMSKMELKTYTQLSPSGRYYKIEVSDNGIGFDRQHAERIFKIFQRLHSKGEFEGTGIGLSICQKIVHNHGGEIKAYPGYNGGATFVILLPY